MKNQFKVKPLHNLVDCQDVLSKSSLQENVNDTSLLINTSSNVDFKDKNFDDVRFVKVNSLRAV